MLPKLKRLRASGWERRARRPRGRRLWLLALSCLAVLLMPPRRANSEPAKTNSVAAVTAKAAPQAKRDPAGRKAKAPARTLSGAELYSIHCNRCHPERYPTERTAAQWKTIMLHMRVRANLPGEQARIILKYLQDNSGR